jgi:hypothetical protein
MSPITQRLSSGILLKSTAVHALPLFSRSSPTILPANPLIEEEQAACRTENFYPLNPGDILNRRYKILTKIGWGSASTVWLVQDTQRLVLP